MYPLFAFIVLCFAISGPVAADAPGLSLDGAVRMAVEDHPQIEAERFAALSAQEEAIAESQLPDPQLTAGIVNLPLPSASFTNEPMTQVMIGLQQSIPGGDKLRLRGEAMLRRADMAHQEGRTRQRQIELAVRQAYFDARYQSELRQYLSEIQTEFDKEIEWAHAAYASGQVSQQAVWELKTARARVSDQIDETLARESLARKTLARWIGRPAESPLVTGLNEYGTGIPSLRKLLDGIPAHPDLEKIDSELGLAQTQVALAREAYRPDWSLEVAYGARPNFADMASAQVKVELPLFAEKRQDRRLAARQHEYAALRLRRDDQLRQLEEEVRARWVEREILEARLRRYQDTLLIQAQAATQSALSTYRTGQSPISSVYLARRGLVEAKMQQLALQWQLARTNAELLYYNMEGTQP